MGRKYRGGVKDLRPEWEREKTAVHRKTNCVNFHEEEEDKVDDDDDDVVVVVVVVVLVVDLLEKMVERKNAYSNVVSGPEKQPRNGW